MTRTSLSGACALAILAGAATNARQQPPPRFHDRVDVARVVLDARVVDGRGNPVRGLTADDFTVRIDRRSCRVESASWVGESGDIETEAEPVAPASSPPVGPGPTPGRLIVFLFQKDLEPSRIVGLIRMLTKSRDVLGSLAPADRVAILSFDSHLEIWTDFTRDREQLSRVLEHGVLFERPPAVQMESEPSLVERLGLEQADHAYGIERALELIGRALEPLPGSKSVVLVGHGFGRYTRDGVMMEADYEPARRALVAARASVFSLDVTDADYHSLEAGLQIVSEETGGFYARTHLFASQAMRRLSGALAGYYVLFVEKPEGGHLEHDVDVKIVGRKGTVLASRSYAEHP